LLIAGHQFVCFDNSNRFRHSYLHHSPVIQVHRNEREYAFEPRTWMGAYAKSHQATMRSTSSAATIQLSSKRSHSGRRIAGRAHRGVSQRDYPPIHWKTWDGIAEMSIASARLASDQQIGMMA
jgi:hypothetical protein